MLLRVFVIRPQDIIVVYPWINECHLLLLTLCLCESLIGILLIDILLIDLLLVVIKIHVLYSNFACCFGHNKMYERKYPKDEVQNAYIHKDTQQMNKCMFTAKRIIDDVQIYENIAHVNMAIYEHLS